MNLRSQQFTQAILKIKVTMSLSKEDRDYIAGKLEEYLDEETLSLISNLSTQLDEEPVKGASRDDDADYYIVARCTQRLHPRDDIDRLREALKELSQAVPEFSFQEVVQEGRSDFKSIMIKGDHQMSLRILHAHLLDDSKV